MPQKQEPKQSGEESSSEGEVHKESTEDDMLDFDDLLGAKERVLKKWRQVGQTGGQ